MVELNERDRENMALVSALFWVLPTFQIRTRPKPSDTITGLHLGFFLLSLACYGC